MFGLDLFRFANLLFSVQLVRVFVLDLLWFAHLVVGSRVLFSICRGSRFLGTFLLVHVCVLDLCWSARLFACVFSICFGSRIVFDVCRFACLFSICVGSRVFSVFFASRI